MDKGNLAKTLLDIDEEYSLSDQNSSSHPVVVIVGGSAFMLRDLTTRPSTHDIDVLIADERVRGIIQSYPNVNSSVSVYMDQIPYCFEDRLVDLDIGAKAIRFKTPSTEDLIVMKLYAQRPNDMQDIESAIGKNRVDWDLLDHLVHDRSEARASALVMRRYDEMAHAFALLKERHGR